MQTLMWISALLAILALPPSSRAQGEIQEAVPTPQGAVSPPVSVPFSPPSQLSALVPVVPTADDPEDVKRPLPTIEATAFFVGKIGTRAIRADETVYVIARPFPRQEARSPTSAPFASFYDTSTKELSLLGGFFQRAALRGQDENTLLVGQKKMRGKQRNDKDDEGNAVVVTPVATTDYLVNLIGLADFDARLYQLQTQRILVQFKDVHSSEARHIARSLQIVVGVRRIGEPKRASIVGPPSNPRDPQADASTQETLTLDATLTDIYVVEAATKKVLAHFVPKPAKEKAPAPK